MNTAIFAFILFSYSLAFSDLENCLCTKNPKDCEVGQIQCKFTIEYENKLYTYENLKTFSLGDDFNPELSLGKTFQANNFQLINTRLFAHACDRKTFDLSASGSLWIQKAPDYPILEQFQISKNDVAFGDDVSINHLGQNANIKFHYFCKSLAL